MDFSHAKAFHPKKASESEFVALHTFENQIRAEQWPEDSPFPLEEVVQNLRFTPPFADIYWWLAWLADGKTIAGRARLLLYRTEQNRHLAEFEVAVLPKMRRQGIATDLLKLVAEQAQQENRRLLQAHTDLSSGEAFMKRLGARMGMASHTNQLNLAELDRNLIYHWQERAPVTQFELGLWKGTYPVEEIESVAALVKVMNTEPRDDLELEDWHWTAEHLRQWQASLRQRKVQQWSMYAREIATGQFAGYTEVFWTPHRPEVLQQGDTGVFPEYRHRGLGRWLKAAMLEKILCDRPQVKRIRTGNADSNGPMLKINRELGFKPYKSWSTWQIELDRVLECLKSSG